MRAMKQALSEYREPKIITPIGQQAILPMQRYSMENPHIEGGSNHMLENLELKKQNEELASQLEHKRQEIKSLQHRVKTLQESTHTAQVGSSDKFTQMSAKIKEMHMEVDKYKKQLHEKDEEVKQKVVQEGKKFDVKIKELHDQLHQS